jgi:predicted AAA+ superfamily ATPase
MNNFIKTNFSLTISGACQSGKTHLIKYIVKSFKEEFDWIVLFSNTAGFNNDYEFLKEYKHYSFGTIGFDQKLKAIMNIQKKNREKGNKCKILMILDDIQGSIKESKVFSQFCSTYRHFNISLIFSVQYITAASTSLREISSHIIIFNQKTANSLKACYENYFQEEYETFNDFKRHFISSLKKYHFYFIDRTTNKRFIMVAPA